MLQLSPIRGAADLMLASLSCTEANSVEHCEYTKEAVLGRMIALGLLALLIEFCEQLISQHQASIWGYTRLADHAAFPLVPGEFVSHMGKTD